MIHLIPCDSPCHHNVSCRMGFWEHIFNLFKTGMYQSGTLSSLIICSCSSVSPFPFRTPSMILKDASCSSPWLIKYTMISSRQQIAVEITASPVSINVWAFPDISSIRQTRNTDKIRKALWMRILKHLNLKFVPNSGTPSDPSGVPSISSTA